MAIKTTTRNYLLVGLAVAVVAAGGYFALRKPFPADTTPDGAYLRIAQAVGQNRLRDTFPYLEDEAQWACFSICNARREAFEKIHANYPEDKRATAAADASPYATCKDGVDAFLTLSRARGFETRLRRDLSGIASVEVAGTRASVVTARGTRYPMAQRKNSIWGTTIFTADLLKEKDKAVRDLSIVTAAAQDYASARAAQPK
jgi:hypothetical protein